jgi:hypothetical protein
MTEKAISALRQRLIDDMTIRRLSPKTKQHYIRHVKNFADFIGRSPDKATAEDVQRYQLRLATIGTTAPTVNISATALRFFFKVTLNGCSPICLSRCWATKTTITGDLWIGHGLLQGADPIVGPEPHARAAICKWARCAGDSASVSRQSTPRASAAAL